MTTVPSRPLEQEVDPRKQLAAIQEMLTTGHRAVVVEPHSLVLWGLAGGIGLIIEKLCFTEARFPVRWQQGLLQKVFFLAVVAAVALVDVRLTRRARRRRDESYPFLQRQLGALTLLLMVIGLLAGTAAWFLGGDPFVFPSWGVLIGLLYFCHGLFSETFLQWAGLSTIALAFAEVALRLPFEGTRAVLVAVTGVGAPALGWILPRAGAWSPLRRWLTLAAWNAAVCLASYGVYRLIG